MTRTVAFPLAWLAIAASMLLGSVIGTGIGLYNAGHAAGRLAAYRETDRVLRDLERALAPIAQLMPPAQPDNGRVE